MAPAGAFIMRNISRPPVRSKRTTSTAASARNTTFSTVV
jgi:hypothetical protein